MKTAIFLLILMTQISPALAGEINRFGVGDVQIIRLRDDAGGIPPDVLIGDQKQISATLDGEICPADYAAFLVITPESTVLIDAGKGRALGGKTRELAAKAGYPPEKITDILLTHMHFDHVGGLLEGDKKAFPNATLRADKKEWESWKRLAADGAPKTEITKRVLDAYATDVALFENTPFPWLKVINAEGHTPGHVAFALENGEDSLVFGGDFLHCVKVQAKNPDIGVIWDMDEKKAREARKDLLEYAARKKSAVLGGHFPEPGAFRFSKSGAGYDYTPVPPQH